jgi:hypothetical protein
MFFIRGKGIGRKKAKTEVAMKMKEHGLHPTLIAEITDLPIEEIAKL